MSQIRIVLDEKEHEGGNTWISTSPIRHASVWEVWAAIDRAAAAMKMSVAREAGIVQERLASIAADEWRREMKEPIR
jgi:hypothetical protein